MLLGCGLLLAAWSLPNSGASVSSVSTALRNLAPSGSCEIDAPCYAYMQAAVDAANPGDEIHVTAGRYTGVSSRSRTTQHLYLNKSATVGGGYHNQIRVRDSEANKTILDAEGQGRVLVINGDINTVIDGLYFVGGAGGNRGVYVNRQSGTVHRNNVLVGNQAAERVVTICGAPNVHLYHNTIAGNSSGDGRVGGVHVAEWQHDAVALADSGPSCFAAAVSNHVSSG